MMFDALITFRSITYAQRGQQVLQEAGIVCRLRRTPTEFTKRGCGYCLELRGKDAPGAAHFLQKRQIPFERLYMRGEDNRMEAQTV